MTGSTLRSLAMLTMLAVAPGALPAQSPASDSLSVLAVADSALAAISRGDFVALTDLMIPEATVLGANTTDGGVRHRVRTRAQQRDAVARGRVDERGFDASARVAGAVAMVWLPYDLYVDGRWSHCGVDVFTLVRTAEGWRIASLAYSIEQPPACRAHPAGAPR